MAGANVLRSCEHWVVQYQRTWRGTLVSSFLMPLLYLSAMGVGVGSRLDDGAVAALGGGSPDYLSFVGPGLLAAVSMQTAAIMATYPVHGAISGRQGNIYQSMLHSPLGTAEVCAGHLLFIGLQVFLTATVFFGYLVAFGVATSLWAPFAILIALLTGLACAAPVAAFSAWTGKDASLTVVLRFAILPAFLFSGTFYPVHLMPEPLQWLVMAGPLAHSTELCRALVTGTITGSALLHLIVPAAWLVIGFAMACRVYRRRLAV
ncbi:ABC-2 type transporter [Streptomyces sp. YIM 130001]|uniref:ABC transporter permease n=1 Tax=Streptomyces sp. YIM 130001 TaxID=2259644 RepID=UPI000E64CD3A|nr:ABC transporter permease [Streptomyces sp. YIM 130001]RII07921.1 ABC-2 type transporter [Streptomyces sp. YIM 130001]